MSLAVYPGSFDPLTLGHVDIAVCMTTLFDVVVIGIAHSAVKAGRHLLDTHECLHLVKEAISHLPGVEVDIVPGFPADYYTQHGTSAIIKGLHSGSGLGTELPMALLNRDLGVPGTVFLPTSAAYAHISFSPVKGVAGYGRGVSAFVPPAVAHTLAVRLVRTPGSAAHDDVNSGLVSPGAPPSRFVGAGHTREDLPWRPAAIPEKTHCVSSMSSASSSATSDPCR